MNRALPQHIGAVLFDMDDTLVDSEQAWFDATRQLWEENGVSKGFDDEVTDELRGGTIEDVVALFSRVHTGVEADVAERRMLQLLQEHLADGVEPMPGAEALLEALSGTIPMAVASNSPSAIVKATMHSLGWQRYFVAMLGTEDVERPKPAPDLYLAAAERCGVAPERCVVVEDSRTGATAAREAGAFVVAVGPFAADLGHVHVPSLDHPLLQSWQPQPIARAKEL
ncbi:HAD family phosphatase [uncultured Tessaracoccus sp.]|uniref:HAD family hydrolase n=1 Tax=uncultured Tessaracoccus sp. TaxID=905023 RepID=UPI00260557C0|nr:HAD family phosphatase [uncultured Tessaracoccus sp.]